VALPIVMANTIIKATNDTFVADENLTIGTCNGTLSLNTTANYGNLSCVILEEVSNAGDYHIAHTLAYFKFPPTAINQIITDVKLNISLSTSGGTFNKTVFYVPDSSWNELTLSYANGSAYRTYYSIGTTNITKKQSSSLFNKTLISNLYLENNNTLAFIGFGNAGYQGSISYVGNAVYAFSNDIGINTTFLNLTTVDYKRDLINITDAHVIYYDIDSGYWTNNTYFSEADFKYDVDNYILYTFRPVAILQDASNIGGASREFSGDSLNTTTCAGQSYDILPITGIDPVDYANPTSGYGWHYSTLCFNLSGKHNGIAFYGAIKVMNNRNNRYDAGSCILNNCLELDFYAAEYAPTYNAFGAPTILPNPALSGINVSISYPTLLGLNSYVVYRYNDTHAGNWSPWFYAGIAAVNYTTNHLAIINGNDVYATNYMFYMFGNDSSGVNYTSSNYTFNALGYNTVFDNQTGNSTIPGALKRLQDSGFCSDLSSCTWIFGGVLLVIITGFAFVFGGFKLGLLAAVGSITVFSWIGLLPQFLMIPLIVIIALELTMIFRKVLGGRNN
jgi:hypothetical protein